MSSKKREGKNKKQRKKSMFKVHSVPGDGNCFFYTISAIFSDLFYYGSKQSKSLQEIAEDSKYEYNIRNIRKIMACPFWRILDRTNVHKKDQQYALEYMQNMYEIIQSMPTSALEGVESGSEEKYNDALTQIRSIWEDFLNNPTIWRSLNNIQEVLENGTDEQKDMVAQMSQALYRYYNQDCVWADEYNLNYLTTVLELNIWLNKNNKWSLHSQKKANQLKDDDVVIFMKHTRNHYQPISINEKFIYLWGEVKDKIFRHAIAIKLHVLGRISNSFS